MSEEDLIREKLAGLFTEALLSDAATDTRSKFSERVAREFLEKIAGELGGHQKNLREEAQRLAALVEAMASERAQWAGVVDQLAAAPAPAAVIGEFGGAPSGSLENDQGAEGNPAQKARRAQTLIKSSDTGQASPAAGTEEPRPDINAYLSKAPARFKIMMSLLLALFAIAGGAAVWALSPGETAASSDTADLKQICATYSRYKNEPEAAPQPGGSAGRPQNAGQDTEAQNVLDGPPANPFASVEYVLADKCGLAGAGSAPAPAATGSGAPPSGAGSSSPGQ